MKKVFVGLSGGVDSSVSAYLLKERGFDVTGVFIKVWYPEFISCDWKTEMHDAMRVCAKLKIPFLLCDLEHEYKVGVIDYMIHEYEAGRTPNPDVMCNKEIKFRAFLDFAIKRGANFIATGHYAQNKNVGGVNGLFEAIDKQKDQSYFLWNLNQEILDKVIFPVGHLQKTDVRKIAAKADLLTANKKDSQGLCFIGHVDMKNFLRRYINPTPGDVIDINGKKIGQHKGAVLYTIGERHDFEIFHKKNNDLPLYVVSKNIKENTITVSETPHKTVLEEAVLISTNYTRNKFPTNQEIVARTRYRQKTQRCIITDVSDSKITIKLPQNTEALAPGQSVVLYLEDECLGGGIIA